MKAVFIIIMYLHPLTTRELRRLSLISRQWLEPAEMFLYAIRRTQAETFPKAILSLTESPRTPPALFTRSITIQSTEPMQQRPFHLFDFRHLLSLFPALVELTLEGWRICRCGFCGARMDNFEDHGLKSLMLVRVDLITFEQLHALCFGLNRLARLQLYTVAINGSPVTASVRRELN